MTFRNGDNVDDASPLQTDICIVGAGAAGITLALALEKSRYRVLLLESGDSHPLAAADQLNDLEITGHPLNVKAPIRRRALGGTTISTYGRSVLLDPIEFESRPWISHQGWPIGAEELARWYPQAAQVLALPHPELLDARHWSDHAVPRAATEYGLATRIHLWGKHINLGQAWEKHLRLSESITLLLRTTAVSCEAVPGGERVHHLACRSLNGGQFSVQARAFVLACGGMENPRLLLLSRNSSNPPAINWDPVGSFYMNHPRSQVLAKIWLNQVGKPKNMTSWVNSLVMHKEKKTAGQLQFAFSPGEDLQRSEGLLNVSSFFYAVSDQKARDARQQLNQVRSAWSGSALQGIRQAARLGRYLPLLAGGALHQIQLKPYRPDHLVVVDQCEQVPDAASRIMLGQNPDRFGCPKLRLDWRIGPETTNSLQRLHELMAAFFGGLGIGRFESKLLEDPGFEPDYQDCAHPTGTTRMSDTEENGVVDSNCRVHGLENLFVTGSSVFPVGGHASPTFIIIALAARLAALLEDELPQANA